MKTTPPASRAAIADVRAVEGALTRPRHNLIRYNRLDRAGHFAAWEQPDLFAAEMRAAFRTLR